MVCTARRFESALRYLDREKQLMQSERTIKQFEAQAGPGAPSGQVALNQEWIRCEVTLSARARDQGGREAAVKVVNAARVLAGLDPIRVKTSPAIPQQQPMQPSGIEKVISTADSPDLLGLRRTISTANPRRGRDTPAR